jgi:hypothetical protein
VDSVTTDELSSSGIDLCRSRSLPGNSCINGPRSPHELGPIYSKAVSLPERPDVVKEVHCLGVSLYFLKESYSLGLVLCIVKKDHSPSVVLDVVKEIHYLSVSLYFLEESYLSSLVLYPSAVLDVVNVGDSPGVYLVKEGYSVKQPFGQPNKL